MNWPTGAGRLEAQREGRGADIGTRTDDMPVVVWVHGVASMPEMGKAAWFKDSEGSNIVGIDDGLPGD